MVFKMRIKLKEISFVIYLVSFLCSVSGTKYIPGYLVFWYGAYFMLANWMFWIWLANVFYIVSFIPKVARSWWRIFFCSLSVVLASFYPVFANFMWAMIDPHGSKVDNDNPVGIGYFLWLFAFVIKLLDSILRFLQMKKQ